MHWPVAVETLRAHVPAGLTIETFAGPGGVQSAWLAVVPFWMSGVGARCAPLVPGTSRFPELNVRTYVSAPYRDTDRPGVYFFSLDAGNALAVWVARRFFHLNYRRAEMRATPGAGIRPGLVGISYRSRRTHRGYQGAEFRGCYAPVGEPFGAERGSLLEFVTDRYCLYSADRSGRLFRCEIDHGPWMLQNAEAAIELNSMAAPLGLDPASEESRRAPMLHYAARQDVVAWWPEPVPGAHAPDITGSR
jgi:uncharacterized protein YqjF (DUF2071 family)